VANFVNRWQTFKNAEMVEIKTLRKCHDVLKSGQVETHKNVLDPRQVKMGKYKF